MCAECARLQCGVTQVDVPAARAPCDQHLEVKAGMLWAGAHELSRMYPATPMLLSDTDMYFLRGLEEAGLPTGCDIGVTKNPNTTRWKVNSGHVFIPASGRADDLLQAAAQRAGDALLRCCHSRSCTGGECQGELGGVMEGAAAGRVCWLTRDEFNAEPRRCAKPVMSRATSVHFNGGKKAMMNSPACMRWLPKN
jgi:hypothetical protein